MLLRTNKLTGAARHSLEKSLQSRPSTASTIHYNNTRYIAKSSGRKGFSSTTAAAQNQQGNTNGAKVAYSFFGGIVLTSAVGTKYVSDQVGGIDGLQRTLSFYSVAVPAYIKYRMHMILGSPDEVWDEMDKATSQQGLEKILELKGFYIKSGQMAAANIGNAFPKVWQETMSVLQDQCPSKSIDVIKSIIESEYGKPIEDVFESFEETPIGAASIGQVHRAKLLHNGKSVVVKIMYPEVENVFRGDVRTIKLFCSVAQPVHLPNLNEVEKQFMTEFDYKREAEQMDRVRINLEKAGLAGRRKLAVVPKPYMEYCTKRVLVMEELNGDKLSDALQKDMERYATRAGISVEEFKAEQEKNLRELKKKGGDVRGPSAKEYNMLIKLLDSKRKAANVSSMLHNFTTGLLPGVSRREYQTKEVLPINHAKLIDDLILIHGHEVLVDGYFNGDPHPGNVLLVGDEKGDRQLGLIDYGQVKNITKEERLLMCKIIVALANDDRKEIVTLLKEAGFKSRNMDEDVIYKYAKVTYDEDNEELTEGLHVQMFMEELQSRDPMDTLPDQFIMVGRTSIMLRGLAHALRQSRSVAKAWKPIAEAVLREEESI